MKNPRAIFSTILLVTKVANRNKKSRKNKFNLEQEQKNLMIITCNRTCDKKIEWMRIGSGLKDGRKEVYCSARDSRLAFGFGSPTCGHSHSHSLCPKPLDWFFVVIFCTAILPPLSILLPHL